MIRSKAQLRLSAVMLLVVVGLVVAEASPAAAAVTVVDTIPVGPSPFDVAITPDGSRAYVANQGNGTVSVIDTSTRSVISTFTESPALA